MCETMSSWGAARAAGGYMSLTDTVSGYLDWIAAAPYKTTLFEIEGFKLPKLLQLERSSDHTARTSSHV